MTKQVFLVDLIGVHTGAHYYNNSFCELFDKGDGINVAVLSNYSHNLSRVFFPYLFNGNVVLKALKLLFAFVKLTLFILIYRKSYFIYQSFGNRIDTLFMLLGWIGGNRFILDVHDLYDTSKVNSNSCKRSVINKLKSINKVIIHSEKVQKQLVSLGYSGDVILVPHFRYNFELIPKEERNDVTDLFDRKKINLLFFGHIRESKGIKELFKLINGIEDIKAQRSINLVVVGSDTNQCFERFDLHISNKVNLNKLLRKVSDSEMQSAYSYADYVMLPYLSISQSGVLESAISYRKPVLASDLPFFKKYLSQYPSFGVQFNVNDQQSFNNLVDNFVDSNKEYYLDEDLKKYMNNQVFEEFSYNFTTHFLG